MNDSPLLKGPGLWEKVSKAGKRYMVGRLGPFRLVIFENSRRGTEGEPDYVLHLAQAEPWKGPDQQKQPARAQEPEEALL